MSIDKLNAEKLTDVVDEYLHWRKVNPHIKGGENYLKRLRSAPKADIDKAISGQPDDCLASFNKWFQDEGHGSVTPDEVQVEDAAYWARLGWLACFKQLQPEREEQQPDQEPLAKARAWPGVSNVDLLQIATNAFCRYNPPGYGWDSRALEAACKAYHKAAIPEQPVDTSDIAHKLEYAFPQISLSALSDMIEYFRPYLRQPERESSPLSDTEIANIIGNAWNEAIKHDKSPRMEAAIALRKQFDIRRRP